MEWTVESELEPTLESIIGLARGELTPASILIKKSKRRKINIVLGYKTNISNKNIRVYNQNKY